MGARLGAALGAASRVGASSVGDSSMMGVGTAAGTAEGPVVGARVTSAVGPSNVGASSDVGVNTGKVGAA